MKRPPQSFCFVTCSDMVIVDRDKVKVKSEEEKEDCFGRKMGSAAEDDGFIGVHLVAE